MILDTRAQQLFEIVSAGRLLAIVGRDSLPLNRNLYLGVCYLLTLRCIEVVKVSSSPRHRTASSVEEDHFNPMLAGYTCKFLFSHQDRPVSLEITAVFGTIRKAYHDRLLIFAALQ